MPLPATGTRVVHKDDHAKSVGPVWQVVEVTPSEEKPIRLDHAKHKANAGLVGRTKRVTEKEFNEDFVQT